MIGRVWHLWSRLIWLLFAPAVLVHELAHIVVGKRWTIDWRLRWNVFAGDRPQVTFAYPEGTENWKIVLANIAPLLLGIAIAPIVFVIVQRRGLVDPIGAYVAISWLAIALPSADDLVVIRNLWENNIYWHRIAGGNQATDNIESQE